VDHVPDGERVAKEKGESGDSDTGSGGLGVGTADSTVNK